MSRIEQDGHMVLELCVNNHPGVMSHVCGLFARRAFNVEAILCLPEGEGGTSRIWLLLNEDGRLEQVVSQVAKLEDVRSVERARDQSVFRRLGGFAA